ncbi:MAG: hypothetical protein K8F27_00560, partial [Sulfuricellaceae bacterium]|nr:hypothetical protein [Sulfuricellaceae bacterium]
MKTTRTLWKRNLAAGMAALALCAGLPAVARAACSSAPPGYTVYAGKELQTQNNAQVNGAKTGKTELNQPAGYPSSYAGGPATTGAITLPPLDPASFPSSQIGTQNISVGNNGSKTVASGSYNDITTGNNTSLNFTGGTYYIDTLSISNNGVATFAAGTYYVNTLTFDNNAIITLSGAVTFYIGKNLKIDNNTQVNSGASASPANLTFNLYNGAEATLDNNGGMKGLIYAPGASSEIQLEENASLTGAIITGGEVSLDNNSSISYGAVSSSSALNHFSISASSNAITCQGQAVTISLHDASHNVISDNCGTYPTITLSTTTGHGDW